MLSQDSSHYLPQSILCTLKKVREVYDNGDTLIIVATDRISAFDVILKNKVSKKGTILTQMSKFWFDYTREIVPNHMLSIDVKDMPEFFRNENFDGNSMMCKKLNMLPIECIVRGYITGSGWASYQKNGTVCGIALPEGLQESEKLRTFPSFAGLNSFIFMSSICIINLFCWFLHYSILFLYSSQRWMVIWWQTKYEILPEKIFGKYQLLQ